MKATCFWCDKNIPENAKRCSRCLLVTYCSKECQKLSWKASHKNSCNPHPSLVQSADGKHVAPTKYSQEWHEIEIDKDLSKWLGFWRNSFRSFATTALDLANHGRDRVITHCAVIAVAPTESEDPVRKYEIVQASVETYKSVQEDYPELADTPAANDFTRMRLIIILVGDDGCMLRLRLLQWNDPGLARMRAIPKRKSRQLAAGWEEALIYAVQEMDVGEVEATVGAKGAPPDAPRPRLPAHLTD